MANTLRFKRGLEAGIPTGVAGEPLFTTDTFDLYIGNGTTNTRFQKYIASGTTLQYLRGDGTLATFPLLTGFVPYTGATANVDLGVYTILAQNATIASSGSGNTATINHTSGSGIGLNITKGGNGEGLYINKTSGSGNAATIIGTLNATTLVKSGGTSSQYLMADGSTSTLTNPVTGTGVSGQVSYWSGTNTQTGSNNLFWDATNNRLGIGTNAPTVPLDIISNSGSSAITIRGRLSDNRSNLRFYSNDNATQYATFDVLPSVFRFNVIQNIPLVFYTNNTERMRLDASGNLGLGVTPSAWVGAANVLQVGTGAVTSSFFNSGTDGMHLASNAFFDTSTYKYVSNGTATIFRSAQGQFRWLQAPSGTAGAVATFTQAMTLTANGRLLLGTTSEGTETFQLSGNSRIFGTAAIPLLVERTTANSNIGIQYKNATNSWYAGQADNGNFAISTTITLSLGELQVARTGSVGIGTTSPIYKMHVYNAGSVTSAIQSFGAGTTASLRLISPSNYWLITNDGTSANLTFNRGGTDFVRFVSNGNVLIGSTTDSGQRLQVTGDTLLKGSGNTSATTALSVQNSDGTNIINVRNDGSIQIGSRGAAQRPYLAGYTAFSEFGPAQGTLGIVTQFVAGTRPDPGILIKNSANLDYTSSTGNFLALLTNYSPTSGTGVFNNYIIQPTINQTGGANGITRGLYVVPTLTAAANWRSIEWSNNTGWGLYGAGTAANFVNGALGVGTSTMTYKFNVIDSGATYVAGFRGSASSYIVVGDTSLGGESGINLRNSTGQTFITQSGSIFDIGTFTGVNVIRFQTGGTEAARITATNRNFHIGTFSSDSGERLQVNGTMKVTGASTFGGNMTLTLNQNAATTFIITNTGSGTNTGTQSQIKLTTDVGSLWLSKRHSLSAAYKTINGSDSYIYNDVGGNITILNDFATGNINMAAGGSSTAQFTIASTGAATFSSSIQAATAIAIGTTPDTNKPFKILKNINATVGINFENTSTSSLAFSAIQMGTDVTGGTKFTNLVYASSGVSASGVYNPDGTSLINNGGGGLNFLGTPTRFYTGGGNGVLRLLFDNEGTTQFTATTPTTNATDGYKQYSADVVAGNAAPHFRTENGAVIKLYQETTGVGNAIISLGGGSSVLDDTTFDGYTLRQIVKALRNQGILQ